MFYKPSRVRIGNHWKTGVVIKQNVVIEMVLFLRKEPYSVQLQENCAGPKVVQFLSCENQESRKTWSLHEVRN